jgi:hypothetical protein
MKKLIFAQFVTLLVLGTVSAQTGRDVCHVYIIDSQIAQKAFENMDVQAQENSYKIIGKFLPKIYEDELTTKHFTFPKSNLIITASVLYSDELMGSKNTYASMLVGIVLSNRKEEDALSATNNAVAEVTYGKNTDKVRAKKHVKVKGRTYLIGIECECNVASQAK